MELGEFVRKSLEQIIAGVGQAGKYASENNALVGSDQGERVEFDIAVTTTEGSESKKGGGISVWGVGANAEGKNATTNASVSRIKFALWVTLPMSR